MKHWISLIPILFLAVSVHADPTDSMEGQHVHIKGTATVSICAEDELRLATNCDSGTTYTYVYDNAGGIVSSSGFSWYVDGDANRKLAFDASSDTSLTLTYGDGSTSGQILGIVGANADGSDSGGISVNGGGAGADAGRGAYMALFGNEKSSTPGQARLDSGSESTADVLINANGDDIILTATDDIVLQGQGSGDVITLAGGGTAVDLTVADDLVSVAAGTKFNAGDGAGLELPNTNTLPATCNIGEIFHDPNSNDCADTGGGDGALCICKSSNTWVLVSNF